MDEGEGGEGGEGDEEAGAGSPYDGCVGWGGWPEKWPKTMGEVIGQ